MGELVLGSQFHVLLNLAVLHSGVLDFSTRRAKYAHLFGADYLLHQLYLHKWFCCDEAD